MRIKLCLLFLIVTPLISIAQSFSIGEHFVVFGTDFSLAKIVTKNTYKPKDLITIDIPKLNTEMIKICQMYSKRFPGSSMSVDTTDVVKINSAIRSDNILTDKRFIFSDGDKSVRNALKNYTTTRLGTGTGFLIVMEKVDEIDDRESFYIVMFDLATKTVLHCDKVEGKLSKIKDSVGGGWFAWKTVIMKTLSGMDNILDFWDYYYENQLIDINAKRK